LITILGTLLPGKTESKWEIRQTFLLGHGGFFHRYLLDSTGTNRLDAKPDRRGSGKRNEKHENNEFA